MSSQDFGETLKTNFELYELQQDLQPSLGKRENLNSHLVTEDVTPSLFDRNGEGLPVKENEIRPQSLNVEASQLENEVCPQSPIPEHVVSQRV